MKALLASIALSTTMTLILSASIKTLYLQGPLCLLYSIFFDDVAHLHGNDSLMAYFLTQWVLLFVSFLLFFLLRFFSAKGAHSTAQIVIIAFAFIHFVLCIFPPWAIVFFFVGIG